MTKLISLKMTVSLLAILLLGAFRVLATSQQLYAQSNPIVLENQHPGTNAWRIDYRIGTISDDVVQQIKGYASAVSVNHGGTINFHVTVNPVQNYTIDIYRMGWYGGAGGRLMQRISPLYGISQPACPIDIATGMVECNWAVAYTLAVPVEWTTGIYLAKLTNTEGFQNYIVFVVRDDNRIADFLYQQPVNTYQAYNNYPDNGTTGKSLYDFNSYGPATLLGTQRAVKVSFNRPYGGSGGADGGGQFADDQWWERYFITWAERMGYDISYSTDLDTHVNGARLLSFKGFLSVGHPEYWSKEMFDAVEAARDSAVNLAFWGANAAYWQVRYEPSPSGVSNRVLVSYKSVTLDPIPDPTLETILWRDLGRAEQRLIGVQYTRDGDFFATQPYVVTNSSHWVWANTGFVNGSVVPGILGYEIDRLFPQYPAPNSLNYTTLAESLYSSTTVNPPISDISQSSIYQAPSGAWVFAAGTMSWVWALDRPGYVNVGIQQAAKNILDRYSAGGPTSTPTILPTTATASPMPSFTATSTPLPTTATPTPTTTPSTPLLTSFFSTYPIQDSFIKQNDANKNFGNSDKIEIKLKGQEEWRGVLQFDLSMLPSDAVIQSATVRLFIENESPGYVGLHRITAPWAENLVNWNNFASAFDPIADALFTPSPRSQQITVNITDLAQQWVSKRVANHGIMLIASSDNDAKFFSRDVAALDKRPVLAVTFASNTIALIQASQTTFINQKEANRNFGNSEKLEVKLRAGETKQSLFQFDLSALASGVPVQSAHAYLYIDNESPDAVNVYRVTRSWNEYTATWNTIASAYDNKFVATFVPSPKGNFAKVDITPLAQQWINSGIPNYGLMLIGTSDKDSKYLSHKTNQLSQRPFLLVTFGATSTPQGRTNEALNIYLPLIVQEQ